MWSCFAWQFGSFRKLNLHVLVDLILFQARPALQGSEWMGVQHGCISYFIYKQPAARWEPCDPRYFTSGVANPLEVWPITGRTLAARSTPQAVCNDRADHSTSKPQKRAKQKPEWFKLDHVLSMILNAPFQPPPILYFKQVYAAVLLPVTCTFAANEDSQGASMLLLGAGPHRHGKMPASQSKERSSMNCLALDVYCILFKHITLCTHLIIYI